MTPVGFIGLGNMGLPMARRLADAGERLVVFDTRAQALQPLVERGAAAATSARAVADCCPVVITSLPSLDSIRAVVLGPDGLAGGKALRIVVNASTIGLPLTEELERALDQAQVRLVDCPISGGPAGAQAGTLSVMVSGAPDAIVDVRHLIDRWGPVTIAGDRPGMAQLLKLTNNILSAVAIAATSEAFIMGAKGGLDPEVMIAAINAGSGRNSMTLDKIPRCVLTREFNFGGPIHLLMKDVDLAIECGEELGVPMWVCQAARLVFKHAVFAGMRDQDVTEIVRVVERSAGYELPKTR